MLSKDRILQYIDRVKNSGMGKNLSLKFLEKFVQELDDGWIPVSDGLPEDDGTYLITNTLGQVEIALFTTHRFYEIDAVAWMPLPQPYKTVWDKAFEAAGFKKVALK